MQSTAYPQHAPTLSGGRQVVLAALAAGALALGVVGLVAIAQPTVGGPAAGTAPSEASAAEQALIDHRAGERATFTVPGAATVPVIRPELNVQELIAQKRDRALAAERARWEGMGKAYLSTTDQWDRFADSYPSSQVPGLAPAVEPAPRGIAPR